MKAYKMRDGTLILHVSPAEAYSVQVALEEDDYFRDNQEMVDTIGVTLAGDTSYVQVTIDGYASPEDKRKAIVLDNMEMDDEG